MDRKVNAGSTPAWGACWSRSQLDRHPVATRGTLVRIQSRPLGAGIRAVTSQDDSVGRRGTITRQRPRHLSMVASSNRPGVPPLKRRMGVRVSLRLRHVPLVQWQRRRSFNPQAGVQFPQGMPTRWSRMVRRLLWEQGTGGSIPLISTRRLPGCSEVVSRRSGGPETAGSIPAFPTAPNAGFVYSPPPYGGPMGSTPRSKSTESFG